MELDDEKLSFSKKVVGTVTWLFVGIIMFSAGTWLIYREIPDRLIDYVDGPFSVIISGYFAKAGMENFLKLPLQDANRALNDCELMLHLYFKLNEIH